MSDTQLDFLDTQAILKKLPHRYPMLLVDRIFDIKGDDSAVGLKNVTINEPFFQGHFPGRPIMPGVLILEAMAQVSGAIVLNSLEVASKNVESALVYFMSMDDVKFRKPVLPGDQLFIHVQKKQNRGKVWKYKVEVKVGGIVHAQAAITAMLDYEEC